VAWNSDYDFVDLSMSDDFCNALSRILVCRNGFQWVRQQTQFIGDRQSNSSLAEVDSQNWIHLCQSGSDLLQFGRQLGDQVLDPFGVMPVTNQNCVVSPNDNEITDAKQRDRCFAVIEDDIVA
jgi:hypothetical protein